MHSYAAYTFSAWFAIVTPYSRGMVQHISTKAIQVIANLLPWKRAEAGSTSDGASECLKTEIPSHAFLLLHWDLSNRLISCYTTITSKLNQHQQPHTSFWKNTCKTLHSEALKAPHTHSYVNSFCKKISTKNCSSTFVASEGQLPGRHGFGQVEAHPSAIADAQDAEPEGVEGFEGLA